MMNTKTLDIANIALMLISAIAAFVLPFELFLFSYAVLGPLHYLTEINWLHERKYFATGKFDYILLIVIGILLFAFSYLFKEYNVLINPLLLVAFFYALGCVVFKEYLYKLAFVALAFLVGLIFKNSPPFIYLIGVFLPTLIHVFLFTGLFMLFGALKSKSKTGLVSVVVFAVCALSFFVFSPQFNFYQVTEYAEKALVDSGFIILNKSIIELFNLGQFTRETVFTSSIGLGIMRFIAFAYTYHYLNWFSKTEVIKWHQVPRKQLLTVLLLWVASVALYAYDYYVGLVALYFLSMLHVLLEFPLNYRSFIGIYEEIKLRLAPASAK
jgi:hypothetical protein